MRPQDQDFDEVLMHLGGGIGQPSDPIGAKGKYTDPTLFHNGEQRKSVSDMAGVKTRSKQ